MKCVAYGPSVSIQLVEWAHKTLSLWNVEFVCKFVSILQSINKFLGLIYKSQLAWVKTIKNHITFQMLYIKLRKCIILKVVGYETQIAWITFIRNGKFYLCIVWPILRCGTWGESVQLKQMFPSHMKTNEREFHSNFNRFGFCVCTKWFISSSYNRIHTHIFRQHICCN